MISAKEALRNAMERCATEDPDGYRDALMPVFGRWMSHARIESALATIYGFSRQSRTDDALTALDVFHGWYRETMFTAGQPAASSLAECLMLRAVLLASEPPAHEESATTAHKPELLN